MAYYRRDYQLEKAKKVVDELGDSEKDRLIKYYIEKKKSIIKRQREDLHEYERFFAILKKLTPKTFSTSDKIG